MKKLRKENKQKIIKALPYLDELFEREISAKELGYTRYAVSYFNSWLSRNDYLQIEDFTDKKKQEINDKRITLFKVNFLENYVLGYDDEIYEFISQHELNSLVKDSILCEKGQTIINPINCSIFEIGGEDYTDIVTFKKKANFVSFSENILRIGLNFFEID